MSNSGITYLKHPPLPGYKGKAWNPVIGCTHSGYSGCDHCWARELHEMRRWAWQAGKDMPAQYQRPFYEIQILADRLREPLSWRMPRLVMVCPQADLFHDDVPAAVIRQMLDVIRDCPQHQFFVPTKRTRRARTEMDDYPWHLPNLGILASISDQPSADALVPDLLQIEGIGWRGVSYEPAVGAVDLGLYDETYKCPSCQSIGSHYEVANSDDLCSMACSRCDFTTDIGEDFPTSSGIDLVIAGCESGSGRRPAEAGWFRDVRGQCQAAGVPFYLKQMELCGQVCERPYLDDEQWLQWVEVRG